MSEDLGIPLHQVMISVNAELTAQYSSIQRLTSVEKSPDCDLPVQLPELLGLGLMVRRLGFIV